MKTIKISNYTNIPCPRLKNEGDHSAEEIFEKYIKAKLLVIFLDNDKFILDLDGTYGYSTGFLNELIKRMTEETNIKFIKENMSIKSDEDPYLINEINEYIKEFERIY